MSRIVIGLVVALMVSGPAWGEAVCGASFPSEPGALAVSLLPQFEKLNSNIPSLSPREDLWLDEEMKAPGKRALRAFSSREYRLRWAKLNTTSLFATMRILIGELRKEDPPPKASSWLLVANWLIDTDATIHLANLVAAGVVDRDALPYSWTVFAGKSNTDQRFFDAVRNGRVFLAQHILTCTLPQILDF